MGIGTLYIDCIYTHVYCMYDSNYIFSSIHCARCNQNSIFGFGLSNVADFVTNIIIKLPHHGVTLCFFIKLPHYGVTLCFFMKTISCHQS